VSFFLGLDLGQAADYTALAVLEKRFPTRECEQTVTRLGIQCREMVTEALPPRYLCRHLERQPLGTAYPAVAEHVRDLLTRPALRGRTSLVVDNTGVGRPVVDMLRAAHLAPIGVTITGGDTVTQESGGYRVPKRDLVGVVQILLQSERLTFAQEMPLVPVLVRELMDFRVKISDQGHDSYGSWREGSHDDLVLAVAVAAWYGERWRATTLSIPSTSYSTL
jgi:hypothetical protein